MNFFITNREIINPGKPDEHIREDGREHSGDNLRFGSYDLASKTFTLFPEPQSAADNIYEDIKNKPAESLSGSARFFRMVYDSLSNVPASQPNDVLFFIHGFNTDLDGVRGAFRTLNKRYVDNPGSPIKHIIIFTWPGRHPLIPHHYFDDKKDAIRSGEAFARAIDKVVRFFKEFFLVSRNPLCKRNINLMVHSMGHRVLKHMMLQLNKDDTSVPELFNEVLLMAADIEYDIFEPDEAFNNLIRMGQRIHVYFHHKDVVLDISKFTKNFSNRLGRYGRKKIDGGLIDIIDAEVTKTKDDPGSGLESDALNHWYYYTSTDVVNDVINVLNHKKSGYAVKK